MLSLLGLAVLVGMHHALEADHLAAVSSLASGGKSLREILHRGVAWGLGHTATLLLVAGPVLIAGLAIPQNLSSPLETLVGLMLIGLGLHVLYRLWRDRNHFHTHRHDDGAVHFHAHSHAGEKLKHEYSLHRHAHRFNWRSLLVGMTHGLAGSAALLLLTATQFSNLWAGLTYVLLFGAGSILGMALVSAAISLPLVLTARFLTLANRTLQAATALVTIAIGASLI
jgi:ABC-type nickel/cobalt efflux system permease component RcnA